MRSRRLANATISLSVTIVAASACVILSSCGGTALPAPPTPTPTATTVVVPMGVDYGLKRQCVRTLYPSEPNFWSENADCPGSAYPTSSYWLTDAEIENKVVGGGTACVGPFGQTVLINGPGSPITQTWRGNHTTGYAVEFGVDYTSITNPCTPPTWSAVGLIDNPTYSNAILPRPDQARLQYDATFSRTLNSAGAVHVGTEMGSDWQAVGYSLPISVSITVETWSDSGIWDCCVVPPGFPPDVLFYSKYTSSQNGITYFGIVFDGSKLTPPIVTAPSGVTTHIAINWGSIIAHAIAENLVPPPANGWANSNAVGADSVVGFEVRNNIAGPGGPKGDLIISNYRESALISEVGK